MAKSRRKISTLPDPHPSPPARCGKYVLYINKGEDKAWAIIWMEAYAAKKFVEACLGDHPYKLESANFLKAANGVTIRTDPRDKDGKAYTIRGILAHRYTKLEQEWELTQPSARTAYIICHGKPPNEPKLKVVREPKPKRERVPRASREGLTTIQDLAAELDMKPRDARAKLRKAKIPKPDAGWAWADDDLEDIKTILRAK